MGGVTCRWRGWNERKECSTVIIRIEKQIRCNGRYCGKCEFLGRDGFIYIRKVCRFREFNNAILDQYPDESDVRRCQKCLDAEVRNG